MHPNQNDPLFLWWWDQRSIVVYPFSQSPCFDGYSFEFFKKAWSAVRNYVILVIPNFFKNGIITFDFSKNILTLISKNDNPTNASHYRPIVCCGGLYKVIIQLICKKLQLDLEEIIDDNQVALIKGRRSLVNNVIIAHDLLRGYKRKNATPNALWS